MKKTVLVLGIAASALVPSVALAQAAAAPASPHTFTGNLTFATDYRFRGVSQTFKGPAVQGGLDYSHASGLYLGTWASNVSGNQYPNGSSLEWDFYGGWKGEVAKDLTLDVGGLYYWYPGTKFYNINPADGSSTKANNFELYAGIGWKWLSLKYYHSLTNLFGIKNETFGTACQNAQTGDATDCFGPAPGNSKGSGYLDFTASFEVAPKTTLIGHVGHQNVRHYGKLDYTDYKLGVTYDYNGWLLGAALVGTDATKGWYTACEAGNPSNCKKVGESTVVLSVGRTF